MKIIDITDGSLIEKLDIPSDNKYWTTREAWAEYKETCRKADEIHTKRLLYGI